MLYENCSDIYICIQTSDKMYVAIYIMFAPIYANQYEGTQQHNVRTEYIYNETKKEEKLLIYKRWRESSISSIWTDEGRTNN